MLVICSEIIIPSAKSGGLTFVRPAPNSVPTVDAPLKILIRVANSTASILLKTMEKQIGEIKKNDNWLVAIARRRLSDSPRRTQTCRQDECRHESNLAKGCQCHIVAVNQGLVWNTQCLVHVRHQEKWQQSQGN